jgi:hypothetical protein
MRNKEVKRVKYTKGEVGDGMWEYRSKIVVEIAIIEVSTNFWIFFKEKKAYEYVTKRRLRRI